MSWRMVNIVMALLLVLLMAATGWALSSLLDLQRELRLNTMSDRQAQLDLRAACSRGNVVRDNERFILEALEQVAVVAQSSASPEIREYFREKEPEFRRRAEAPAVQHRNCATLYPINSPTTP